MQYHAKPIDQRMKSFVQFPKISFRRRFVIAVKRGGLGGRSVFHQAQQ